MNDNNNNSGKKYVRRAMVVGEHSSNCSHLSEKYVQKHVVAKKPVSSFCLAKWARQQQKYCLFYANVIKIQMVGIRFLVRIRTFVHASNRCVINIYLISRYPCRHVRISARLFHSRGCAYVCLYTKWTTIKMAWSKYHTTQPPPLGAEGTKE